MQEKNQELSFEEALSKLEEAVSKLENGEIKLDEAFLMFEQGIKYAKICEEKLTEVEEKVAKIINDGQEEEFKVEE
mgnify:CR=1 FL=1